MTDIYTDGSCLNNPGPGGWAAIIMADDRTLRLSGTDPSTTNNRMELTAAIKGLEALPPGTATTVHSDSEYLVRTMTRKWKRNVNLDLWEQLDLLIAKCQVEWEWVKGHAGDPLNEEADRLAVAAMEMAAGITAPAAKEDRGGGITHLDAQGSAHMVDVGAKPDTQRMAVAKGVVVMKPETLALVLQGRMEKGDVFTVARIAGITAAKRAWELVPLAHQVPLNHVSVEFEPDPAQGRVAIIATARTTAKTGVEMEALIAVSLSALAMYDMCKAADRAIVVREVRLLKKSGGHRGDYVAAE